MYIFKYHFTNNFTLGPGESFFFSPEKSSEHFLTFRNSALEYVVEFLNL